MDILCLLRGIVVAFVLLVVCWVGVECCLVWFVNCDVGVAVCLYCDFVGLLGGWWLWRFSWLWGGGLRVC